MQPGLVYHFGTIDAPQLFTGECTRYSVDLGTTRDVIPNMAGAARALALHSQMGSIEFEAQVTSGSTDFLDLSAGPALGSDGLPAGLNLARSVTERWRILAAKTCSVSAMNFPDATIGGGDSADPSLTAFTPVQGGSTIALPGDDIVYSTVGLTHAAGEIQEMSLTQMWTISPGKASPDGKLRRPRATAYMRTLSLSLLATGAKPAVKSVLTLTGAPSHAADFKIERVSDAMPFLDEEVYQINAVWIPPFSA